ncbi:sugar ABC transporter permease [Sphingomonas panacis]|uniref:Sugar ABC transporter permease n=1 Tax=Sphingomonas panacis TaxID=1560345 RepID=A0A1B3ZAE5_9SPHN|nr:ABC transporter permease [Sphingomonas panacis]AOH84391.1 sugar ABC transporter permease [Sphingomonas panacis]
MSQALPPRSLARSAEIQLRVIWALMMREVMTRYGRHNIGFLWLFVEPMLFTLGVTALWSFSGLHRSSSLPITAFALTGYSTVLLWRNMPMRCVGSILPNSSLMYHRNVRVMDIFLSRTCLEAAGATMSFTILSLLFWAIEWMPPPEDILSLAQAWLLTAWFGMALAILLGTLAERSEMVEKLWHPAAYLLFPLSGAAFLVESTPEAFQKFILWIPMVHCTEMVRAAYFGSKFTPHYDAQYLIACNLVLTLLGLALERQVSREFIPE